MSVDLTGRPIAITGASSGIGRATAIACARAGMPVAAGARRADRLIDLINEIESLGGRAIGVQMDVTKPEDNQRFVAETVDAFGSIYSVFANAGYGSDSAILDMSDEALRAIFETNFFGTMNTIRPAIEQMRQSGGTPKGHVLICSSCVARMTIPNISAYTATKAAQAHIGTAMRVELAHEKIYVSTVHPIGTKTEFFDQMRDVTVTDDKRHRAPASFSQPVSAVSERIVKCLRKPHPEIWTGPKGWVTRLSAAMMTASPRFGDFIAKKSMP